MKKLFLFFSFSLIIATLAVAQTGTKTGTPLPAGGGEPGKAYLDYCHAIEKGDMQALKNLVSADRAKQMDSPDFKKMFPMIQAMQAKEINISGGTINGAEATLNAQGKDRMDGGPSKGTITMVKEDNKWKVKQDSWQSGGMKQ